MLVGRCTCELSGRKLQRKIKSHKLGTYPDFLLHSSHQLTEAATSTGNPGKPSDCLNCQVVNSWKSRQRAASENAARFPLSHEYGDGEGRLRKALPAVLIG
jgi:hypothetical protein